MMNEHGKSDGPVVPAKPAKISFWDFYQQQIESMEGSGPAKGEGLEARPIAPQAPDPHQQNTLRAQNREGVQSALARVHQAARKDKKLRFTSLLHHIYNPDTLREAYFGLKRDAAPGMDGQTWQQYGQELESNLHNLSDRLKRGAYRAKPTRRVYIPKADGKQRPLGVTALEDKLVQRATTGVLNTVYEADFLGFSYGFRPGRSQHNALDALYVGLLTKKVNWVLDADIRGFFDTIDRDWLMKFVEHRIADQRVGRLIRKWLNAGVLEDGVRTYGETGTVQGGSISPLLANVYLHYAFDLWVQQWRTKQARGDVIVVRYADDFIVGFQDRAEAEKFLVALRERFAKFGLELHPDKTRLIEFGQYAAERRRKRGLGRPETFDFLGLTHACDTKRSNGRYTVLRQTMRKRLQAKLAEVKFELRWRMHDPVPEVGKWLGMVVAGHCRYYGVPMNGRALGLFRFRVGWLWQRAMSRRSQRAGVTWDRMTRLIARYLPPARIHHPYPLRRFGVIP
jgi:group II intron reverse transcriptase/maturase